MEQFGYIFAMVDVFTALAHPVRRALVDELRGGPRPAGSLGQGLGVSREAISKHLRLMTQAEVLTVEARGRERWYALSPQSLACVDDWLAPYRHFWQQHLDALDTEVARGRRATPATTTNQPSQHAEGA